jgi:UPF0755 protein
MKKFGFILFSILFIIAAYVTYNYASKIYLEGVDMSQSEKYFYIKKGTTLAALTQQLYDEGILKDTSSFLWVAEKKSFDTPKAGRFLIKDKMSNNKLINILRSGMQKPLKLTLNSVRTLPKLASKVGKTLYLDSANLIKALADSQLAAKYGFDRFKFPSMIIPNTYEFYWDTDVEEFLQRMANEYKRFWTEERKQKAQELGLSQSEVSILASIVQAEQQMHRDERPKVAGVYLNRLEKGMRLQSDPTLIFALNDYSIKRVLNEHKKVNSPYNTYKYPGLPPGPINIPEISSIDAVLNADDHNYIYMCAKSDFSGYHHFAATLNQHNRYAAQYRRELNRRRIMQ